MNDISYFRKSLEDQITEVEQKTSTLRDHLSEATDKQVINAGDSIDRAIGIGELNTRIEIHERYVKVSNFLDRVPPDFLNTVPLDFLDRVPGDFHRVVPHHSRV